MTVNRSQASEDLGVVDALRVPGADLFRWFWGRLPIVGRVFAIAAVVDVVVRALGVANLPSYFDPDVPLTIVTGFAPHYALALFPAVVLARRPDAARATPLMLGGAITLAVIELLSPPLRSMFSFSSAALPFWTTLEIGVALGWAAAVLALAFGLRGLTSPVGSQTIAGLGNVVGGVIAVAALAGIVVQLLQPRVGSGVPEWDAHSLVVATVAGLGSVSLAVLARAVIHGFRDPRRPREATGLAAGAMLLEGTNAVLTLAFGALLLIEIGFRVDIPVLNDPIGLGLFGTGVTLLLLVVAFGLGLGDTSVRMPGRHSGADIGSAPKRVEVAWPSPGTEVPPYRPVATAHDDPPTDLPKSRESQA